MLVLGECAWVIYGTHGPRLPVVLTLVFHLLFHVTLLPVPCQGMVYSGVLLAIKIEIIEIKKRYNLI